MKQKCYSSLFLKFNPFDRRSSFASSICCCSSIAALSQLLNVNTLYRTTVAAYRPNKAKTIAGRKRITCFHCVINGAATFPVIVIIHIPRNTVANKSHCISFVILLLATYKNWNVNYSHIPFLYANSACKQLQLNDRINSTPKNMPT